MRRQLALDTVPRKSLLQRATPGGPEAGQGKDAARQQPTRQPGSAPELEEAAEDGSARGSGMQAGLRSAGFPQDPGLTDLSGAAIQPGAWLPLALSSPLSQALLRLVLLGGLDGGEGSWLRAEGRGLGGPSVDLCLCGPGRSGRQS